MRRQVRELIAAAAVLVAAGAARADAPPSSRVEKPAYVVEIAGAPDVKPGAPAQLELKLAARGGFHLNADYPTKFTTTPPPAGAGAGAVKYPKPKIDRASGIAYEKCAGGSQDSCSARAQVPFVVDAAGTHAVGGTFAFSVCDAEQCLIEKVPLGVTVVVK